MQNSFVRVGLIFFFLFFCPASIFAEIKIERNMFGLELGTSQKDIEKTFLLTEGEDAYLWFAKKRGNIEEYNRLKNERQKTNSKYFQVGLNKNFPPHMKSVDIHLINDFLYQMGFHYNESYAKKVNTESFLAPFIQRYGYPLKRKDSQTVYWIDNLTKLEISFSSKIINVFLYDLDGRERAKDEKTNINDYKNEINELSEMMENQSMRLFIDLDSIIQELQVDQTLQPKTLSSKLEREKYSNSLVKLLNAIQETEKRIFEVMDSFEDKIKAFKLPPQELDKAVFEYKKARVKVDRCFRKYFDIEKQFVFKVREVYDYLNQKEGSFYYEQGQIIFKKDSDLAEYRYFIIEIQSLYNQEMQARLEMQNIAK